AATASASAATGRFTTLTRRGAASGTNVDRFGLPPEHEQQASFLVELHDLAGRLVDGPDVVLRIDPQPERGVETVDVLSQLAHELAAGIELEETRPTAIEGAVIAECRVGMAGSRVDEDAPLRSAADSGHLAKVDVRRCTHDIGVGVEGQLRH